MKIVTVKIKDLIQAEYNPRKLSTDQYEHIKSSLNRFGIVDPIIVNSNPERKNIIIGGHQRTKVWKDLGNDEIPVYYIDLTLEKEKELNVRLNKNTGEFDQNLFKEFFDKSDLLHYGFNEKDLTFFDKMDFDSDEIFNGLIDNTDDRNEGVGVLLNMKKCPECGAEFEG
jgi:hypothetical protein